MECFYKLLGWQGGTGHQVAAELGVDSHELLYGEATEKYLINGDYMKGQFAYDTCSIEHNRTVLLPEYKGNLNFWLGYKRAAELKAKLKDH